MKKISDLPNQFNLAELLPIHPENLSNIPFFSTMESKNLISGSLKVVSKKENVANLKDNKVKAATKKIRYDEKKESSASWWMKKKIPLTYSRTAHYVHVCMHPLKIKLSRVDVAACYNFPSRVFLFARRFSLDDYNDVQKITHVQCTPSFTFFLLSFNLPLLFFLFIIFFGLSQTVIHALACKNVTKVTQVHRVSHCIKLKSISTSKFLKYWNQNLWKWLNLLALSNNYSIFK